MKRKKAEKLIAEAQAKAVKQILASYDGAARSHRTAGKRITSSSANLEIWRSHHRLRDVHRELVRNNPYAARAITGIAANVVGAGIVPSIKARGVRLRDRVEGLATDHFDSTDIDFDGRNNLFGLHSLSIRSTAESGEVFIVRYPVRSSRRLAVPFQVRILESDFLDTTRNSFGVASADGSRIIQGIEFDADGRRAAYYLWDEHPGDMGYRQGIMSKRVPAEDVIHLFRVDRPGQIRGIPWGAPVIIPMWDLGDYEDAELMRQKIAACFAVFYTRGTGRTNLAQSVDATGKPVLTPSKTPVDMLEPGMLTELEQGADVKFATPPTTTGYPEYLRSGIRKIAVGYGVPYEMVAGDLSQVNFSSGRMGWLEFQRNILQWQWHLVIPHLCMGITRWFKEAAVFSLGVTQDFSIGWTEPRREMIDPTKEIPAARDAIRSGLSSRSEELRRLGYDPMKVDAEIEEDQKRADDLKLSFDSDGRHPVTGPVAAPAAATKKEPANAS